MPDTTSTKPRLRPRRLAAAGAFAFLILALSACVSPFNGITEIHQIGAYERGAQVQAPNPQANPTHPNEYYTSGQFGRADRPGGPVSQGQCANNLLADPNIQWTVNPSWGAIVACDTYYFWYFGSFGYWVSP